MYRSPMDITNGNISHARAIANDLHCTIQEGHAERKYNGRPENYSRFSCNYIRWKYCR